MRKITLSELLATKVETFTIKDNSPRGAKTISASQLKVGDMVALENTFKLVVEG